MAFRTPNRGSGSKQRHEDFTFYPPQNVPFRYQEPLANEYLIPLFGFERNANQGVPQSCSIYFGRGRRHEIPWYNETGAHLESYMRHPLSNISKYTTQFIYIFHEDLGHHASNHTRSGSQVAAEIIEPSNTHRDLTGNLKEMIIGFQISPECLKMAESFSCDQNFYTTASGVTFQAASQTTQEVPGTFLNGPGFQICYTLFFKLLPDGYHGMRKVLICNNFCPDVGSLWFFMSDSPNFQSFLKSDSLQNQIESRGSHSWENTIGLHLAFCTLATVGWQTYLAQLRSRLNTIIPLGIGGYPVSDISELLRIEAEIGEGMELLISNQDSQQFIVKVLKASMGDLLNGHAARDNLGDLFAEFEFRHEDFVSYITEMQHLKTRTIQRRKALTFFLSIETQDKSYETSVNHLKVSFLSQNFMRGLGFAIMLFIPGIFASTLFSSQFFYFTDSGIISASRGIWVWVIIVVFLSLLTFWVLIVSFHTQLGQPLWAVLKGYITLTFMPWRKQDLDSAEDSIKVRIHPSDPRGVGRTPGGRIGSPGLA